MHRVDGWAGVREFPVPSFEFPVSAVDPSPNPEGAGHSEAARRSRAEYEMMPRPKNLRIRRSLSGSYACSDSLRAAAAPP